MAFSKYGPLAILLAALPLWGRTYSKIPEYANDLGPDTIDVSSYPEEIQKKYALFLAKCSVCHSPARAINSELTDSKEWARYIKIMQLRPPCCNFCPVLSHAEAKAIWEFLVYDSRIRKTGPHAAEWAQHRAQLLQDYKTRYPKQFLERYGPSKLKTKE